MPLLSNNEYLDLFGNAETIRLTDETKTGVVDTEKLSEAIQLAEDFAIGYVARKYAVPLASAPRILKGFIADLARERLAKDRPTTAIQLAADRARSALQDISTGKLVLPLPEGGTVESMGGSAKASGDGRREIMTEPRMDSYIGFGLGYSSVPNWRR